MSTPTAALLILAALCLGIVGWALLDTFQKGQWPDD